MQLLGCAGKLPHMQHGRKPGAGQQRACEALCSSSVLRPQLPAPRLQPCAARVQLAHAALGEARQRFYVQRGLLHAWGCVEVRVCARRGEGLRHREAGHCSCRLRTLWAASRAPAQPQGQTASTQLSVHADRRVRTWPC